MPPAECDSETAKAATEVLDALGHHLRRVIIDYFENAIDGDTATVDEIAAHAGARAPDSDPDGLSTALVHKHLPKLESDGWLEFDHRSAEVRYHGHESAPQRLHEVLAIFAA
ncbi:hypothetical protein [Halosimplex sp. TS25]|uniref:DUF7344 domain-containing protein n=1 Tax=Halosimplex rarum TaxID=3396619 RepID=UPI0039ED095B